MNVSPNPNAKGLLMIIVGMILAKMESALILRMITNVSVNLVIKVSKFQNESSFLPKYESNIIRIFSLSCATLQGRNPYNFWFKFW